MSDLLNWKQKLHTFCASHSFSAPKYKSKQLLSDEWESECTVQFASILLLETESNIDDDNKQETVTTTSTKPKKKQSQSFAAQIMLKKLNRTLSKHVVQMRHAKHMKKLENTSILNNKLDLLESLFTEEHINNSVFMQKLIQSNKDQWVLLDDIVNMAMFSELFGKYGWNDSQYQKNKNVFIEMVEKHSKILEMSTDRSSIRRIELLEDLYPKNQMKSEELKLNGNQLFAEKKYKESIMKYLEAMKYNESDYKIAMNLSLSYLKIKDLENALKFANKAINLEPHFSKPYARAAMVLFEMNQIHQAISTMDHATHKQSNNKQQYIEYQNKWKKLLLEDKSDLSD